MFSTIAEEDDLGEDFYQRMATLEDSHHRRPTQQSTSRLIQMYSDSVQYFDTISEPVAVYFQSKLKKLMVSQSPKRSEQTEKRKKAEAVIEQKQIISHMAQEGQAVQQVLQKQLVGVQEYQKKITNIIDQQKEQLQSRRKRNLRRCLTKSASLTMSVESMFDSPTVKTRADKKLDTLNLFESLIDSEI